MKKYPIQINNKEIAYVSHIGVNHTASGTGVGGNASSYNKEFDNEDFVSIETGIVDMRYCKIGDISEAYKILKEEIFAKNPHDLQGYCDCVENTVLRYFGNFVNVTKRLSYFPSDDDIDYDIEKRGSVSDIAHKNAAMCVERAMLSQNLLLEIGIKSFYKASGIIINGKPDSHAYNLIEHEGNYYIFDATIPTIKNGNISPLICEIPKEVFDKISRPESNIGISVTVSHYNPLQQKNYDITYDAGRKEVYIIEDKFTK